MTTARKARGLPYPFLHLVVWYVVDILSPGKLLSPPPPWTAIERNRSFERPDAQLCRDRFTS